MSGTRLTGGCARLAALLGLALVLTSALAVPAVAHDVRIRPTLFGLHDNTVGTTSLDTVGEGWLRVWDSSVRWDHLETSPGIYQWDHLDAIVDQAVAHHAQVTLVVAMTPSFYSPTPTNVPATQIGRYRAFVRAMMTHFRGRVGSYQVWNESNIGSYWTGTPRRMARLTKVMHDVRDAVDPSAKVVAPSMVTRLRYELKGITAYFRRHVGGRPVWRYVDALAFSLYPMARYHRRPGVPEDVLPMLAAVRSRLHATGVPHSMPLWDTEINYGLRSGSKTLTAARPITDVRQAAYVVRTFLLQAGRGVQRVGWYRYDWPQLPTGGTIGNTLLTDPDDPTQVTAAGRAYALVEAWLHGTLRGQPGQAPCPRDRHGTYHCVVSDSTGTRHVFWNPFARAHVRLPVYVRHWQGVLGGTGTVAGGSRVAVGFRPVMYSR